MVVVSYLIHQVQHLGLKRWLAARIVLPELVCIATGDRTGVFGDTLPDLPGQVQTGKTGVTVLQDLHDPQGLPVVVEPAVPRQKRLQHLLPPHP